MLKVGELAARAGLTVRTLHHYDSIGLLTPSARSDAGYRLYGRDDLARLHQIQTMRSFGMALADIGAYLDSPGVSPLAIIARQIAALERQIDDAGRMRGQLLLVHGQLSNGETPELDTWLTTLEQMTMYDKYFSKAQLQQLPLYQNGAAQAEWKQLVAQVSALMRSGVAPGAEAARHAALRWMTLLERDTAGNPDLLTQLDKMHDSEPSVQRESGISPQLKGYVTAAIGEVKLALYANYLTPGELERMRLHQRSRAREWPVLIGAVKAQMLADPSPQAPRAQALAGQWMALFEDMVGGDPATLPRFRQAIASEPLLQMGRGMTDAMIAFLRSARPPV